MTRLLRQRRWLAPEVVQSSAMDCGPAALKCLLEGMGIPVSYGRLREACQTSVDGSSIDTLEVVAGQLGLRAEQVMIPLDHVFLREAGALPALAVLRQADGAAHFVVVWRKVGRWVQVMDPASGRRWLPCRQLAEQLLRHQLSVAASDWRAWAATHDFLDPLRARLQRLGVPTSGITSLISQALADEGWFSLGALDASIRLVQAVIDAGGLPRGDAAARLVRATAAQARAGSDDIFGVVPSRYWSATPDAQSVALGALHLRLQGAVLVRVNGRRDPAERSEGLTVDTDAPAPLSRELAAALDEAPPRPLHAAWTLLRQGGRLGPAALLGAVTVATGALVIEALLLRGAFDIAAQLGLPSQRLLALAALVGFAALLLMIELPIVAQSMRLGRHLETRLRMALLTKLPRLHDRYFHSRPVSDMADRSHALQFSRGMPSLALNLVQGAAELLLTWCGVVWLAPHSAGYALAIVAVAVLLPLLIQPWLVERDLRVRNHGGALHGFMLDALLGAVPVRTHRAEDAVRRHHEGLLVHWVRARRAQLRLALSADALQGLVCMGLTAALLISHFVRHGSVGGADLLLVYWAIKLPALGGSLSGMLQQWPMHRNVLLRLMEPLGAPEEARPAEADASRPSAPAASRGAEVRIDGGRVVAAGQVLLDDIDLQISAGEHVAIVGASGAGKSSLLGLLLGWHHLASGTLSIDGRPLDAAVLATLRSETAWVDPGVQLWNRSMLDNLLYAGDDDGLARVGAAVQAAGLRSVLQKLPDGLQSPLGEGGALLSGGEGQRVRLGRALLQTGVRLALLDEAFRGLDRGQRAALMTEARQAWRHATLLCVTHDVGETRNFDRVLVVDDGRIVEDGPPAALLAAAGPYARLLQAEEALRQQVWEGSGWRELRVDGGTLWTAKAVTP